MSGLFQAGLLLIKLRRLQQMKWSPIWRKMDILKLVKKGFELDGQDWCCTSSDQPV